MTLEISPQDEQVLEEVVRNGHFKTQDEALSEAIRLLRDTTAADDADERDILPPDEWVREFSAWAKSHKPRNPNMDDSRESIYEGRGL